VVVDKTGTLTKGKPELAGVKPAEGFDETRLLFLAASLERASEHPLAAAIVAGAEERGIKLVAAASFESAPGKGVTAIVDGVRIVLGNRTLMSEVGIDITSLAEPAEAMRADGQTAMFVAVDGKAAGLIGVDDPIRPTTPEAVRQLRQEGVRVVMLTGDSKTTAEAVA